jgi:RND family efflux transporter MFP subunit
LVRVFSFSLSALLFGGLAGGYAVWRTTRQQLEDPDFLTQQLEKVSSDDAKPGEKESLALVRVSVARRKPVRPQRPIVGRLVEVRKVTVASEVAGKIDRLPVEVGTPVVGDTTVLAELDTTWSKLARDRSQAQADSALAQLDYQRIEMEREEDLHSQNAISVSELQSRQATVKQIEAQLKEAQVSVEQESERIERSTIVPPFDGTVVVKHAEQGGYVSPGDPIVDIVSRGQIDALLMVPESVVNLIAIDQVLPICIDALQEDLQGRIVSVTPYGPMASRTFPVRVRLDDQAGRLKVGMSVSAVIATGPQREALVVPKDAVLVRPDGSNVWVALPSGEDAGRQVLSVPVTISVRLQDEYAIEPETEEGRKHLTDGSSVVVEGAERLRPGQRVDVDPLEDAPPSVAGPKQAGAQSRSSLPDPALGHVRRSRFEMSAAVQPLGCVRPAAAGTPTTGPVSARRQES